MIEVSHLTKRYGENYAVHDISFEVDDGEILGFLGPNGAGKSTTMNIITGYLSSNEGTVKIDGVDVLENPLEAKKKIGYLPELPPLYMDMTVDEYLSFVWGLKQCKLPREAHLSEICGLVRIQNVRSRLIRNLSKGYRQRVGIAQALVGNPDVLILDEPTVGLDPKQIIEIRTLIKHLSHKHTVILSSHILPEVQSVCERIVIINRGKIVANGTTASLSRQISRDNRIVARIAAPEEAARDALNELPGVIRAVSLGMREEDSLDWQIETEPGSDVRRPLFDLLAARHWPLLSLDSGELSLEDIFLRLTSGETVLPILSENKTDAEKPAKTAAGAPDEAKAEEAPAPDGNANEEGKGEKMSAIFKRELRSYFTTASGYVFLAVFYALSGFMFVVVNLSGSTTDVGSLFSSLMLIWVLLVPILTMRLLTEDKRQKTDQLLLTAPVRLFDIVWGKFLAAFAVFGIAIGVVIIYALLMAGLGTVDFWATVGSFIGMALLGGALISIGLFVSSLTENQVVAAVASFFIMLMLYLIDTISSLVSNSILSAIVTHISIFDRFQNFSMGVFNIGDTVYFISVAAIFLFLTVRLLEKRRWA